VIGISGERGPLLEHSDIRLVVQTIEDTDLFTPTVSRLAALVVIDILATAVSLRRGPSHVDTLSRMKSLLADYRRRFG
jgi:RpiR family carbohydrate utilization transcriptional regulator